MPPDIPNEQELILKKRARRRLVGAIALVVLMVIILPRILMDRATLAPQESIKITMPEVNSNPKRTVVNATTTFGASSLNPSANNESIKTEAPIVSEVAKENKEQDKSDAVKRDKENENKPMPVKTENKIENKTVIDATDKHEVNKLIDYKKEKKVVELKSPQKNETNFTIQIGVYSDMENVKNLQMKLKLEGLASHVEKISTPKGEKFRLKAGDFSTRKEALKILEQIQGKGFAGMVMTN